MSDNLEETLGEAELVEGLEKKRFSGKTLVVLGGGAVVALLVIIGVMSLFGGEDEVDPGADPELDRLAEEAAERRDQAAQLEQDRSNEELELLFVELEEQRFNLNTGGQGTSFLSAKIILEVDRESYRADLEAKMPRILDEFNTYMRELRPEDLDGSAGIFRLKEELLMRINQAVAPTRVKDVLFQQFLVQG
ncbi:MAG: flagellar basal body-associated FliL family protein [Kordiimonadaceae bacterium]|nr:flagellar basal body-associated FliL family protein [Kordiimonadaceae bacterium]MBO6570681.1 flagellar basal body-associated FliL family protein [Kordiimonadaceae bacterium]MBO6966461.1 flagellar basal body-associated FliL family protein [Kordiimonadaceae bacterium]